MSLSSLCVVTNALRLRSFQPEPKNTEKKLMRKKLLIEGMSCGHCAGRVEKALGALPGVNAVEVDLASGCAVVSLTAELADEALTAAVTGAGYEVTGIGEAN
jgi:copper chaperone CopZ